MRAGEERYREAHILGEEVGEEGHRETRRRHVGFDCIHPPTQTEAMLGLGQASASLPAPVFFHKSSLLCDPVFTLRLLCEKVSPGLKRDYIYI